MHRIIHLGDTVQFAEYIERNIRLHQIRYTHELRPSAAASWIRRSLADSLRSRSPYAVNLLLAGFDTSAAAVEERADTGGVPKLYWCDYLGTLVELPFAAHGYANYFVLGLLDRYVSSRSTLPRLSSECIRPGTTIQMRNWTRVLLQ